MKSEGNFVPVISFVLLLVKCLTQRYHTGKENSMHTSHMPGMVAVLLPWVLILGGLFCHATASNDVVLVDFSTTSQTVPQGWELVVTKGTPQVHLAQEGDTQVLRLRSEEASFGLQREVTTSLHDTPILKWQWKVTELPDGGDFRQRRTDDQAAQLVVAFSSRHFISYIWDSTAERGTTGKGWAPPFSKLFAFVLRSGSTQLGTWITERRNLLEDYKRLFGKTPTSLRGIRIQINSQHTRSDAESSWKSIVLTSPGASALQITQMAEPLDRP